MNWGVVLATLTCVLVANAGASAQYRKYRIEPPLGSGPDWRQQLERQQFERERERLDERTKKLKSSAADLNREKEDLNRELNDLKREAKEITTGLETAIRNKTSTVSLVSQLENARWRSRAWEQKAQIWQDNLKRHNEAVAELNNQWQDWERRVRAANGR